MADNRTPEERQRDLIGVETASKLVGVEEIKRLRQAEYRAEYLQAEMNIMRRVMQGAGTWAQFCHDYAVYKSNDGIPPPPPNLGVPESRTQRPNVQMLAQLRQATWEAAQFLSYNEIREYIEDVIKEIRSDEP